MREGSPPSTCHVSCVTCHVSHVTCHMSRVMFFSSFFGQSGEAYRWRVCYQWGLPRLVFTNFVIRPASLPIFDLPLQITRATIDSLAYPNYGQWADDIGRVLNQGLSIPQPNVWDLKKHNREYFPQSGIRS